MIFDLFDLSEMTVFKKDLVDQQRGKDLVHYSIVNKQLIVEFIWSLTQIDSDYPLFFPHADRLLAHLTSSMIDLSLSISFNAHEFYLLPLLLSRRAAITTMM
jgi:hypothetical protein